MYQRFIYRSNFADKIRINLLFCRKRHGYGAFLLLLSLDKFLCSVQVDFTITGLECSTRRAVKCLNSLIYQWLLVF